MTDEQKQTHYDLLHKIERNDRRFRLAQSIFMTLLILGFIAGGYFAAQAFQSQQFQREQENA